jgi:hypothetical protein
MAIGLFGRLEQATRAFQRDPRGKFSELLQVNPWPLINPDARLVVLFSPKSACTNVAIWFFHHLVGAATVRAYNDWPHRYRKRVYYPSDAYRKARAVDLTGFRVIRVIRDPFDRAASTYRHVLRTTLAETQIARALGEPDMLRKGLSFERYLTFLEQIDLKTCDPHFRPQRHPLEDVLPVDYLINISKEDLWTRLGGIERELGLPPSGAAVTDWMRSLDEGRRPSPVLADAADADMLVLTKREARKGPWPRSKDLLTPRARERLARLYDVDIRSYL